MFSESKIRELGLSTHCDMHHECQIRVTRVVSGTCTKSEARNHGQRLAPPRALRDVRFRFLRTLGDYP